MQHNLPVVCPSQLFVPFVCPSQLDVPASRDGTTVKRTSLKLKKTIGSKPKSHKIMADRSKIYLEPYATLKKLSSIKQSKQNI